MERRLRGKHFEGFLQASTMQNKWQIYATEHKLHLCGDLNNILSELAERKLSSLA